MLQPRDLGGDRRVALEEGVLTDDLPAEASSQRVLKALQTTFEYSSS